MYVVYTCTSAEYCTVVYHSQLTDEQDEILERQQNHCLKLIFGLNFSAGKMREKAGICTLRNQRIELCDKFAAKAHTCTSFGHWFPKKEARTSARPGVSEVFKETTARCERLRNLPVHFMRRRLNGKPGKTYGQRNKYWRER